MRFPNSLETIFLFNFQIKNKENFKKKKFKCFDIKKEIKLIKI